MSADLRAICGHVLRRAQQRHAQLWLAHVGDALTTPQFAVLAALDRHPGVDQRTVGGLTALDSSSATELVRRVIARGWVDRQRDVRDGRRYVLALTFVGADTLREAVPGAATVQRELIAPIAPARRASFLATLAQIADISQDALPDELHPVPGRLAPGALIRRAQQRHATIWAETIGPEPTGPQYAALLALHDNPAISQKRLGELAGLDRSNVADIVARLHARGEVRWSIDPLDRRARVVTLSARGRRMIDDLQGRVDDVQRELLGPLAVRSRPAFLAALESVATPSGRRANRTAIGV